MFKKLTKMKKNQQKRPFLQTEAISNPEIDCVYIIEIQNLILINSYEH